MTSYFEGGGLVAGGVYNALASAITSFLSTVPDS